MRTLSLPWGRTLILGFGGSKTHQWHDVIRAMQAVCRRAREEGRPEEEELGLGLQDGDVSAGAQHGSPRQRAQCAALQGSGSGEGP